VQAISGEAQASEVQDAGIEPKRPSHLSSSGIYRQSESYVRCVSECRAFETVNDSCRSGGIPR
jgi:hypothetical protein